MFIRVGLLDPLSSALVTVTDRPPKELEETSADLRAKILQVLVIFCQVSQSDAIVRGALGVRKVVRRTLLLLSARSSNTL